MASLVLGNLPFLQMQSTWTDLWSCYWAIHKVGWLHWVHKLHKPHLVLLYIMRSQGSTHLGLVSPPRCGHDWSQSCTPPHLDSSHLECLEDHKVVFWQQENCDTPLKTYGHKLCAYLERKDIKKSLRIFNRGKEESFGLGHIICTGQWAIHSSPARLAICKYN